MAGSPGFEVEANVQVSRIEKTGFLSERKISTLKRVRLVFDATTGELVHPTLEGLRFPFPFMSRIDENEIEILRNLPSTFSLDVLVGMGLSPYRARKVVGSLSGKGIIRAVKSGRRTNYELCVAFPSDPTIFSSRIASFDRITEFPKNAKTVSSTVQAGTIVTVVEDFWLGSVDSVSTVYYPFFIIKFKKEDSSIRYSLIDAISGKRNRILLNRRLAFSSPT